MKRGFTSHINFASSIMKPTAKSCCAIIVTYYPDSEFLDRLILIKDQFPNIIIVNNSKEKSSDTSLQQFITNYAIKKIDNYKNYGIAYALNQGIKYAQEKNYIWAVFFDQDTVIYKNFFSSLITSFIANNQEPAVIGSNYHDTNKNRPSHNCDNVSNQEFCEHKTVITSGSIVPLQIPEHIGGFREDFFIDSVDHEFCLRARHYGYKVLLSCATTMCHSIGQKDPPKIFRWSLAPSHSPERKYYMTRNSLITAKTYLTTETLWSIRQVFRFFLEFTSVLILEDNKIEKIKAIFKGIWHGIVNRMEPWQK